MKKNIIAEGITDSNTGYKSKSLVEFMSISGRQSIVPMALLKLSIQCRQLTYSMILHRETCSKVLVQAIKGKQFDLFVKFDLLKTILDFQTFFTLVYPVMKILAVVLLCKSVEHNV